MGTAPAGPRLESGAAVCGRRRGVVLVLADSLHDGVGGHVRDAAVALRGELVVAAGRRDAVVAEVTSRGWPVVDTVRHRGCVTPGFVDAHVHLLRAARDAAAVDCRPPVVTSIAELLAAVGRRAATTPAGEWVEAAGYHEFDLTERRHPTAAELDAAAGGRCVRLRHRSGHAAVVGTAALRAAGIDATTPDPPGGRIVRDPRGEPTGLLLGRAVGLVRPPADRHRLRFEVATLSRRWLSRGVTTVCDAGPDNDRSTLATFVDGLRGDAVRQRVVLMQGSAEASSEVPPWVVPDDLADRLWPGPVKLMVSQAGGDLFPPGQALGEVVARLSAAGRRCAIHAASLEAVTAAVAAMAALPRRRRPGLGHRIEHASVLPDALLEPLRRCGASVVTHPLFVARHGDRYLAAADDEPAWLYRCASLRRLRVTVAAGSDAPVVDPDPLASVAAAVERRTPSRVVVGPAERLDVVSAIALHTGWAAAVCGLDRVGRIAPGSLADLVFLPADPVDVDPGTIAALGVEEVWLGGRRYAPAEEVTSCSP